MDCRWMVFPAHSHDQWGRQTLVRVLRREGKARYGKRSLHPKALDQAEIEAMPFRRAIAAHRPATREAPLEVQGVGPRKLEMYGAAVIGLVLEHLQEESD
jgi:hypothetical protein